MTWIDQKYISLLSGRLQKFKRRSPVLFNFRCPMCGDSKKNRNKARAYIFQRDGKFWVHCHNCAMSLEFSRFLKEFDSGLYHEYRLEAFGDKHNKPVAPQHDKSTAPLTTNTLSQLESIASLRNGHKAYLWCANRKIPKPFYSELYYCSDFQTWTNLQLPNKFSEKLKDEERIIIPLFDSSGKMFGYQGRALGEIPQQLRYITIMLDESKPKIWGLNHVDFNRPFYVTEGPFDAMFLSNSIATVGGKITSELYKIGCNLDNAIIVYDNEPRNHQIVKNVNSAIRNNFRVVIWPSTNHPFKDVNEYVLGGFDIESYLKDCTYYGLGAELEFNRWRKV